MLGVIRPVGLDTVPGKVHPSGHPWFGMFGIAAAVAGI
jgi:hypothetical protein